MMRALFALLTVPTLMLVVACGDLSQEDLLFLGAIPAKEALTVRPAGSDDAAQIDAAATRTQAMEEACAHELDVKCRARNIAIGLNSITFRLLALVDAVVEFPPSKRERGRRVWGPFFNLDEGNTARFEMVRVNDTTYRFCLHAVAERIRDRDADDITCDTDVDDDSGLAKLLEGELTPGRIDAQRARFGRGFMTLQTGRIPDLAAFGRTMDIEFDNTEGRTDIAITVEGQRPLGLLEERRLEYDFTREANGAGTFGFVMFANIHDPGEGKPLIEQLDMVAEWNSDEAGVGRARVTDGELGIEQFIIDQCWDGNQREVFLAADFTGDELPRAAVDPYVNNDEAQCPFLVDDVPLPEL